MKSLDLKEALPFILHDLSDEEQLHFLQAVKPLAWDRASSADKAEPGDVKIVYKSYEDFHETFVAHLDRKNYWFGDFEAALARVQDYFNDVQDIRFWEGDVYYDLKTSADVYVNFDQETGYDYSCLFDSLEFSYQYNIDYDLSELTEGRIDSVYLDYDLEDVISIENLLPGFSIEQLVTISNLIEHLGWDEVDTVSVLQGIHYPNMVEILEQASHQGFQSDTIEKWESYQKQKKGDVRVFGKKKEEIVVQETQVEHRAFLDKMAELFSDDFRFLNLNNEEYKNLLLIMATIESDGMSQINENGLMQITYTPVFEKYLKEFGEPNAEELGLDLTIGKKDYRSSLLVATMYLDQECFSGKANPMHSIGGALLCYNRGTSFMRRYFANPDANRFDDADADHRERIRHVARYLVLRNFV